MVGLRCAPQDLLCSPEEDKAASASSEGTLMVDSNLSADVSIWPSVADPPAVIRAVVFDRCGGPDVLQVREVPMPECSADEVLVRVAAVSVGRLLDVGARAGTHPFAAFTFPHILGAEHAGTVAAVGSAVRGRRVGDRVAVFPVISCGDCGHCRDGHTQACAALQIIGIHRPGAYADYAVSPSSNVYDVPKDVSPVDAAGLALAGSVAQNQLLAAAVKAGDWLLVQGGGSSLGSLTAALAVRHRLRVIATSRSAQKRRRLLDLGVEVALDPTAEGFVPAVLRLTDGRGVDVAIDDLGEPRLWTRTLDVLASCGTVVSSGAFLAAGRVQLDLMRLYLRNQRIIGVRTGNAQSTELLWRHVGQGLRPIIDRTFPVGRAADAHRYLEFDQNMGRVVLTVGSDQDWAA